jgi:hypothetical protein
MKYLKTDLEMQIFPATYPAVGANVNIYLDPLKLSTHIMATEQILCKIWGFHGNDYEERHLLGYKTPVRTPQETHYVSTTESSQLMLCKIWGFHGGD